MRFIAISLIVFFLSCVDDADKNSVQKEPTQEVLKDPFDVRLSELQANRQERLTFISRMSSLEKGHQGSKTRCFADNTCLTNLHKNSIPKTAYLADYNTSAFQNQPDLMACFPEEFLPYVPQTVLRHVKEHGVALENVTLCWNIQFSESLGSHAPDSGFTRLKAHGWAAPDAPADALIKGDLVNRNFLFGVYEPDDQTIESADVKVDRLLSFPVHVHESTTAPISPSGMAKIGITSVSKTQAFWSLVIDNNHPADKPLRAGITLHWILKEEFIKGSDFGGGFYGEYRRLVVDKWLTMPFEFKQVVKELKNNTLTAQHPIMKSLEKLLADVWAEIN